MKLFVTGALAMLLCVAGFAQPGFKNFDIASGFASSSPVHLTVFGNRLYFYATDGSTGRELYWVDAAEMPAITKNINPGLQNTIGTNYMQPCAGMGNKFYFTANNASAGEELFEYDGTNLPKLTADLTFGPDSSMPDNYVVLNNKLYFRATTAAYGYELYQYDGTQTPKRLTDIDTGAKSSVFGPTIAYNNKVYFIGNTDSLGAELWYYDPVKDTAMLAADIDSGMTSSNPANLTIINNKMYFSATTIMHGREMYEYDGTNKPVRITDISASGLSSLSPIAGNAFALFKDSIYFGGRDTSGETHLWRYYPGNGSVALAAKINPNGPSDPRYFAVYNNRLFFSANDGANGLELFAYDGVNPPALIGDLCQGPGSSVPTALTPLGNNLYFTATDCTTSGVELFRYNYIKAGIRNVLFDADVNIYPNPVVKDLNIDMKLKRSEKLRIKMTDINGRLVYDGDTLEYSAGKHKIDIPMGDMAAGHYIYYIVNDKGTTYLTGKVVKQ